MLIPAGYRVLIKPHVIEEKTSGGIILPEQVLDKDQAAQVFGTVVGVGEFAYKEYPASWVNPGDVVCTARYAGFVVKDPVTGEEYRAINDIDVICKVGP